MLYQLARPGLYKQIQHIGKTAQAALEAFNDITPIGFGVEDDGTVYVQVLGQDDFMKMLDASQPIRLQLFEAAVHFWGKSKDGVGVHYVHLNYGDPKLRQFKELMAEIAEMQESKTD